MCGGCGGGGGVCGGRKGMRELADMNSAATVLQVCVEAVKGREVGVGVVKAVKEGSGCGGCEGGKWVWGL